MVQTTGVTEVAHVIQLAVAPVFLLTGIGAFLGVMTNRLARIVDRARLLEGRLSAGAGEIPGFGDDLSTLAKRARLIGRSIALCTITALLICALIAVLFLAAFLRFDASVPVALLFIGAMLTFFVGLVVFLREIFLAIYSLRIGHDGKSIRSEPVLPR
jgi:hypothetical protein